MVRVGFTIHSPSHAEMATDGHSVYNLLNMPIDNGKTFLTMQLLTIEHMAMFVVKSLHILNNGHVMDLLIAPVIADLKGTI